MKFIILITRDVKRKKSHLWSLTLRQYICIRTHKKCTENYVAETRAKLIRDHAYRSFYVYDFSTKHTHMYDIYYTHTYTRVRVLYKRRWWCCAFIFRRYKKRYKIKRSQRRRTFFSSLRIFLFDVIQILIRFIK